MDETTDTARDDGPDEDGSRNWRADAESALDDVTTALQAAWAGSRDARSEALEAARGALVHLGAAIDQATQAARDSWGDGDAGPGDAPTDTPAGAPPDEATIPPPPPTPPSSG